MSKTTKKKTRTATKKTTSRRRGAAAGEEPATRGTAEAPAPEGPSPATRRRRTPAAARGRKRVAVPAEAVEQPVPEAPVTPATAPPAGPPIKPYSPSATVAEEDGRVVIRFPPAAPPPFAPVAASVSAAPPAAQVAVEPEASPAPPVVEELPERPAVTYEPPEWVQVETPETTVAAAEPEGLRVEGPREPPAGTGIGRLTPSQKRRLRRKRQRERRGIPEEGEAKATVAPPPGAATAAPPTPAVDPTPWLEAAAAIKAGLSEVESESGETGEAVEPELAETPMAEVPVSEAPMPESGVSEVPPAPVGVEAVPEKKGRRRRRRGRRSARHESAGEGAPEAAPEAEEAVVPAEAVGPETVPAEAEAAPAEKAGKPSRLMIINAVPREECRIAVLANGRLEEIYLERATAESHVGNIYRGIVTNVEPSIQAAFIDFGQGKNGFLHISDLHPQYFPNGAGQTENVGHKMPRRARPPIQRCLRRGQEIIVQVTKEGIGTKGPTLSTYLSIPGRFLVMMPGMGRLGVSRRIEDDASREKLRATLSELELPEGMGFIARTAALNRTKRELQSDLNYLLRLWRAVENRAKSEPAPAELYRESDLVIRTIRDTFTGDVERILVDDPEVAQRARDFLSIFNPRYNDIVQVYTDPVPIFHKFGIEAELERLHSRRVPLPSGGYLVIEPTEALVAIDVNSGRFRTEDDAEATAYKINLEAADEIARQLRLRDLGGVVVCDFIDMRSEAHRREIERRLARNLREHKERAKVLRMSEFGIIELTRQRQRASLTRSVYQDCRHCHGTGLVKTVDSVALDVLRLVQLAVTREHIHMIELTVSPEVAFLLQNRKRRLLYELESKNRRVISIRSDPNFSLDQVEIRCTDSRGRLVPHT